ncbi:unnamed protein product [Cochlearia groenlandica]
MSSQRSKNAIQNPTLELKIISATNLSHMDSTDKIDIYAVVSMNGGGDNSQQKKQAAKTPIDYDGGSNPTWNHTVKFSVNTESLRECSSTVRVKFYSYWLEDEDDLYMGEVNVSVQDLLLSNPPFANGNVGKMKPMTYPVKFIGETKPDAKLSLSYRFRPVKPVNDDMYPTPTAPPFGQPVYTNPDPARPAGHDQPIMYYPTGQSQTITVTKLALELVVKSARDILNVNVFDDMDVYASVRIRDGNTIIKKETKTPIAYSGFKFPTWNHAVKFSFDEDLNGEEDRFTLIVELVSHRPFMGDKHIGEVKVRIRELFRSHRPSSPLIDNGMKLVTRKVTGSTGEQGTLSFSYRFLEEQVTIPTSHNTITHPYIMYIPFPHQSFGSTNLPVHAGPSNGLTPVYMPPPYQPHGYQQYSQPQPQNLQPPPPPRPQQPTQPQVEPQGGSGGAALGLGAAVLGRVVGGALMSEMMSGELNIFEM